jgi:hypothetical protein
LAESAARVGLRGIFLRVKKDVFFSLNRFNMGRLKIPQTLSVVGD